MKKIITLFILIFCIYSNTTFAELSTAKQNKYKTQIDNVLNNYETKLSNISNTDKINKFNTIIQKIDKLLSSKKLSEKNSFVLNYLKESLNKKLESYKINNNSINETNKLNQNSSIDNTTNTKNENKTNTGTETNQKSSLYKTKYESQYGQINSTESDYSQTSQTEIAKSDDAYFNSLSTLESQRFFTVFHSENDYLTSKDQITGAKSDNAKIIEIIKAGPNKDNSVYYEQYIKDYNLGISYYRDGGFLNKDGTINEQAIKFLNSQGFTKDFTEPYGLKKGVKTESFNSTLKTFGYYVDTKTWTVKYDASKNQYKDDNITFPYIKGSFETGFTTY